MKKDFPIYYLVVVVLSFGFTACQNKEAPKNDAKLAASSFDLNEAKATIDQNNKGFVADFAKADSAAIAARYSKDAKLLPDGAPAITGTDKIKGMWGSFARSGMNLKIDVADVWGNDELLTEEGTYSLTDKAGKQVDQGKYIVVWKKEDGQWKMFRDIWNSDGKQ
jgi:ketosteroid isomerase-like protein